MRGQRFYQHTVDLFETKSVPDGAGGTEIKNIIIDTYDVFIDTPSASEQFQPNQSEDDKFERFMYYQYGVATIKRGMTLRTIEEGETITYKVVGKPENQGGRNRVMRAKLTEVP